MESPQVGVSRGDGGLIRVTDPNPRDKTGVSRGEGCLIGETITDHKSQIPDKKGVSRRDGCLIEVVKLSLRIVSGKVFHHGGIP